MYMHMQLYISHCTYIGLKLAGLSKSSEDAVTKNDESSYDVHNENILSDVELQYFKLINKLTYLLSSKSVQFIIDILSSLMAHESSGIKLFPLHLIEMFRQCNTKSSLLQALFPYSSFCDYSIFEELLEKCFPEGVELPNNKIDLTKCISTYSILKPSPLIIPDIHSCFTLMATRHNPEFPWLQFKCIISIKSVLLNTFTLSKCACTLVAIGSTICYWRILKRIARYITDEIHKHLDCFKNQLLFNEIAIYQNDPEIIFSVSFHREYIL